MVDSILNNGSQDQQTDKNVAISLRRFSEMFQQDSSQQYFEALFAHDQETPFPRKDDFLDSLSEPRMKNMAQELLQQLFGQTGQPFTETLQEQGDRTLTLQDCRNFCYLVALDQEFAEGIGYNDQTDAAIDIDVSSLITTRLEQALSQLPTDHSLRQPVETTLVSEYDSFFAGGGHIEKEEFLRYLGNNNTFFARLTRGQQSLQPDGEQKLWNEVSSQQYDAEKVRIFFRKIWEVNEQKMSLATAQYTFAILSDQKKFEYLMSAASQDMEERGSVDTTVLDEFLRETKGLPADKIAKLLQMLSATEIQKLRQLQMRRGAMLPLTAALAGQFGGILQYLNAHNALDADTSVSDATQLYQYHRQRIARTQLTTAKRFSLPSDRQLSEEPQQKQVEKGPGTSASRQQALAEQTDRLEKEGAQKGKLTPKVEGGASSGSAVAKRAAKFGKGFFWGMLGGGTALTIFT